MNHLGTVPERISEFQRRMETEQNFCKEVFEYATVRLLCHKYAYYVCNAAFIDDSSYDSQEKDWYIMGRALGLLNEDETSPCIDFDDKHPKASKGIALAKELMRK